MATAAPIPRAVLEPPPQNPLSVPKVTTLDGYGIGVSRRNGEIMARWVRAGGACDKAGIEINDYILKVGKVPVGTTWEFYDILSTYRPGAVVTMEVRRGGVIREAKVHLILPAEPNWPPQMADPVQLH